MNFVQKIRGIVSAVVVSGLLVGSLSAGYLDLDSWNQEKVRQLAEYKNAKEQLKQNNVSEADRKLAEAKMKAAVNFFEGMEIKLWEGISIAAQSDDKEEHKLYKDELAALRSELVEAGIRWSKWKKAGVAAGATVVAAGGVYAAHKVLKRVAPDWTTTYIDEPLAKAGREAQGNVQAMTRAVRLKLPTCLGGVNTNEQPARDDANNNDNSGASSETSVADGAQQ